MSYLHGEGRRKEEDPFIFRWSDKYGLSDGSAAILMAEGFNSAAELLLITSDVIKELPLSTGQKLLLRGALLQFKEGDVLYAQRRAQKYRIPFEQALFLTKQNLMELSRSHPIEKGPSKERLSMQELDERLELRRRIRRKKTHGQSKVTLAEQIQTQRQNLLRGQSSAIGGSKYSLASESSLASYGTVQTEPGHVTSSNQSDQRITKSAADVTRKVAAKSMGDVDKAIEEILSKHETRSTSGSNVGQDQSHDKHLNILQQDTISPCCGKIENDSHEDDVIERMEREVDSLLRELKEDRKVKKLRKKKEEIPKIANNN